MLGDFLIPSIDQSWTKGQPTENKYSNSIRNYLKALSHLFFVIVYPIIIFYKLSLWLKVVAVHTFRNNSWRYFERSYGLFLSVFLSWGSREQKGRNGHHQIKWVSSDTLQQSWSASLDKVQVAPCPAPLLMVLDKGHCDLWRQFQMSGGKRHFPWSARPVPHDQWLRGETWKCGAKGSTVYLLTFISP